MASTSNGRMACIITKMVNCFQYWTLRLRDMTQLNYISGRCVSSFCHVERQQNIPRQMYEISLRA
eukprot:255344-Ditylum_brightwellii.AAC.1